MTTLKQLAAQTGQELRKLETMAAALGFSGSDRDELPADIETKLTSPKQLNAAAPKQSKASNEENGNSKTQQGTPENIYAAFGASNSMMQHDLAETEKIAAQTAGAMAAHQYYMNYQGAYNAVLQSLMGQRSETITVDSQNAIATHQLQQQEIERKALMAVARSDKTGKSLRQVQAEMMAVKNMLLPPSFND